MKSSLVLTVILTVILMVIVIVGLGIGLILTGKSRLRRGCGMTPKGKKEEDNTCSLCGDKRDCEDERGDRKSD